MTYLSRRIKLSDASIRRLEPPAPGQREVVYWDATEPGFGIRLRRPTERARINASFILQRDLHGKAVKVTIGRYGPWTVDQARKRARELKVEMDRGENPNERQRRERTQARRAEQQGLTLADAVTLHLENMVAKNRSPVSIGHMENETEKYLADQMPRPLLDLDGQACRDVHKRLTKAHGIYIANRVLRHVRAAWNTAARVHDHVPERNPTKAVVFHQEHERDNPIAWDELPAWWAAVLAMRNPVLRDLQLFYLFTGLRRNDGKSVRWEHLDFDAGTVHRPNPKGGKAKAFTVPVCSYVLDLLRRRREDNRLLFGDDGGFVFPSRNRKGETTCVRDGREQRYDKKGKKLPSLPSPHRLRHTFATAGHEAYLRELDLMILMNHSRPKVRGNVTRGYVHPSLDHLRCCAEKVATFLLEKAGAEATIHNLYARSSVG